VPPVRDPDPREARFHRVLPEELAPGKPAYTDTNDRSSIVPVAGEARFRLRFKATVAGTLKTRFLRPGGTEEYTANNPGDVAVVANTETKLDVTDHYGEGLVKFIFTPNSQPWQVSIADLSHV
jgi:hypothetical protein